jgi:hypothetical protein
LTQLRPYVLFIWFVISGWRWQSAESLDAGIRGSPNSSRAEMEALLGAIVVVSFSLWQWSTRCRLPVMPLNVADQILMRFADALAAGVPEGREVHSECELADSKVQIKTSLRVVLASLAELQMRTGFNQSEVIVEFLSAACHLYDFAPPDVAERIQSHANDWWNREPPPTLAEIEERIRSHPHDKPNTEFTSFIAKAATSGIALKSELGNMVHAILALDIQHDSFRQQLNVLVGVQTASPLNDGGSIFRVVPQR